MESFPNPGNISNLQLLGIVAFGGELQNVKGVATGRRVKENRITNGHMTSLFGYYFVTRMPLQNQKEPNGFTFGLAMSA